MNRIDACFAHHRGRGQAAFIPFVTCGDPSLEASADAVRVLADSGADIIELGVPFSDPVADGPVIQRASWRAINAGANLSRIIDMIADLRAGGVKTPFVMFGYYNPVLRFGVERLVRDACAAGADGLLVADLPPEEGETLAAACAECGLARVCLVAPNSSDQRIARLAQYTTGFLYAISLAGVTGVRDRLPDGVEAFVKRLRANTDKPLALGFGISTPEMVEAAGKLADGVVVGSAIVRFIEDNAGNADLLRRLGSFVRELSGALRR
jgi:tryptophan synthase alpha chain